MLTLSLLPASELKEYSVAMPIYDVRDFKLAAEGGPGIFTFGGLIGEIMISLSAFHEMMITRMELPQFEIRREQVLKFMEELLLDGFNPEICFLKLSEPMLTEREMLEDDDEM